MYNQYNHNAYSFSPLFSSFFFFMTAAVLRQANMLITITWQAFLREQGRGLTHSADIRGTLLMCHVL